MADEHPPPVDRITAAALALVAERGMSGVTMSAVAERAGVARQTVYNHFADIDAIILAAHERHSVMADTIRLLETAANATEKIDLLVRHTVAAHGDHGAAFIVEQSLAPAARETLRRHARESRHLIASILSEGVEAGVFRTDLEPDIDARLIQGALFAAGETAAEADSDASRIASTATRTIVAAIERTRP